MAGIYTPDTLAAQVRNHCYLRYRYRRYQSNHNRYRPHSQRSNPLPSADNNIRLVNTNILVIDFDITGILFFDFLVLFTTTDILQQRHSRQWPKVSKPGHTA